MDGLIQRYFQDKYLCQDLTLYRARDGSTPITYLYQVVRAEEILLTIIRFRWRDK